MTWWFPPGGFRHPQFQNGVKQTGITQAATYFGHDQQ
jgi:hypothetical protein